VTLDGRRVLVTGGGSGLGVDLARGFAAAGADVVVSGRRAEPLDAVAATDDHISAHVADVTDEAQVVRLFDEFEPFDIVVANAGAAASAPLTKTTLEVWSELLAVNLTGVFLTLREGVRRMRGREWGRLITIAWLTPCVPATSPPR
jgi:NAD(P)-dependent dehydrogenase (short-subunit alcohol dehydrogenase family)